MRGGRRTRARDLGWRGLAGHLSPPCRLHGGRRPPILRVETHAGPPLAAAPGVLRARGGKRSVTPASTRPTSRTRC
eukprot:3835685-Lingulodinium_polyedra.AAC.1